MSQLPPQAYTRDMLSAAYEWLHSQPGSVRELATDSNTLVSLYLQSRRRSSHSMIKTESVPSAEIFKQDLKTLAEGLKQFEGPKINISQAVTHNHNHNHSHNQLNMQPPPQINPMHNIPPQNFSMPQHAPPPHVLAHQTMQYPIAQAPEPNISSLLDAKSLEAIRKTQMHLNLSSEGEALRLLLAMGFDQIRSILPKN